LLVSVKNQAAIFIISIVVGTLITFIYDIIRVKRRLISTSKLLVNLEDLGYWLVVAICIFAMTYYSNDGELRGYFFIGIFTGCMLYILALGKFIMKIFIAIVKLLIVFFTKLYNIISFPIKFIYKILKPVFIAFFKCYLKTAKYLSRIFKILNTKMKFLSCTFKNIRKKV